jgi:triosephosphate isomerase
MSISYLRRRDYPLGGRIDLERRTQVAAGTRRIPAAMLLDVGCKYVIIGHSERRQYFGETDETVNRRVKAALSAGLDPIVCVGEVLEERKAGRMWEVVGRQTREGLAGISRGDAERLVLAYEPVWAIGTGETATPEQAQEVHAKMRGLIGELYGEGIAQGMRIQYGGSVKPDNVRGLMDEPDVDGALVGGASLKVESFLGIVKF